MMEVWAKAGRKKRGGSRYLWYLDGGHNTMCPKLLEEYQGGRS